jgi:hypothetical protein
MTVPREASVRRADSGYDSECLQSRCQDKPTDLADCFVLPSIERLEQ